MRSKTPVLFAADLVSAFSLSAVASGGSQSEAQTPVWQATEQTEGSREAQQRAEKVQQQQQHLETVRKVPKVPAASPIGRERGAFGPITFHIQSQSTVGTLLIPFSDGFSERLSQELARCSVGAVLEEAVSIPARHRG